MRRRLIITHEVIERAIIQDMQQLESIQMLRNFELQIWQIEKQVQI